MKIHGGWNWCGLLLVLVTLGQVAGCRHEKTVYRLDKNGRYLEINQVPDDGGVISGLKMRDTQSGKRQFRWLHGDCEWIFEEIHGIRTPKLRRFDLGPRRVIIETQNPYYYDVLYDTSDKTALSDLAEQLGLEVVIERRQFGGWILELTGDDSATGLEPYQGKPKWPLFDRSNAIYQGLSDGEILLKGGAYKIFKGLSEGAFYRSEDSIFFDGVSLDEFARILEELHGLPVTNRTGKEGRYSFMLPERFWNEFDFDKVYVIDSLGIKVTWSDREALEVVVVRDKESKKEKP